MTKIVEELALIAHDRDSGLSWEDAETVARSVKLLEALTEALTEARTVIGDGSSLSERIDAALNLTRDSASQRETERGGEARRTGALP